MKFKQVAGIAFISAATTLGSLWGYNHFKPSGTYSYSPNGTISYVQDSGRVPSNYARFFEGGKSAGPADFVSAASAAIPATVHIKTKTVRQVSNNLPRKNPFSDLFGIDPNDFFGDRSRSMPEMGSGSGVIISEDGYIVTNNHVVDGADEVTVTLSNKKSFKAKVVATDPSTDLAVVKVDAKGLPFLLYGNSDEIKVGQWVLAVGYPLSLETTVTAGIVSAKGRSIDINSRQSVAPVESFIQTDAAVNPGNSGGPLINPEGQLIGINSAIASPTGSYAGYSFTIPVNIVKKVVTDLIKYGTTQRAYLGIEYARENLTDDQKKEKGIKDDVEGVYILNVKTNGAAYAAGLKEGDLITKLNGIQINTGSELVGQIAIYRPGDKIKITYERAGKENEVLVTLMNNVGNLEVVKNSAFDKLGAELQPLQKADATKLNVKGGIVVTSISDKGLFAKTRMEEGFVILKVNGQQVASVDDFRKIVEQAGNGSLKLEGVYPGYDGSFTYPLKLNDE
jgi:serine protease Do